MAAGMLTFEELKREIAAGTIDTVVVAMPRVAILDPELTLGLPPKLTAATGMDAMAHCIESYCAPFYHPLAAGVALEGLRLVKENLARAVKKGTDIDARGHMLMASTMGATAFQRGLGAIHALSHPFGGLYDAHHGMLNGIIMIARMFPSWSLNQAFLTGPLTCTSPWRVVSGKS